MGTFVPSFDVANSRTTSMSLMSTGDGMTMAVLTALPGCPAAGEAKRYHALGAT